MSSERKAVVNHDDVLAVVSRLWSTTRDDYVRRNTEPRWRANVAGFDDTHLFHHVAALAVACGFVESMEQVWGEIRKDYGFVNPFADDND